MPPKNFSLATTAVTLAAALLLVACGDSPESLLSSAKEYMAKEDHKAAVIQIKNALQKQPDSGEARFLLGSALLATGDAPAAEIELQKARDFKHPDDEVVPKLVQALLLQGKNKKAIEDFAGTKLNAPAAVAGLQTSLASAYGAEGNVTAARQALDKALTADPQNVEALLLEARHKLAARDIDGAVRQLDALLARDAKNADVWRLKGDIFQYMKAAPDEALGFYRKAIEAKPNDARGYFGTIGVLTRQNKLEDAEKDMVALKKIAPKHPETMYLDTQLSYVKRDFPKARELAQELLRVAPQNPRALEIAGGIDLQRNALVTAEEYLSKAVQASPNLPMARRWLVTTYLRLGQAAKARTALGPLVNETTADSALLSLAGEVQLMNGDAKAAEALFARASKLDPADGRKRTVLAVTQMASGQFEAGLDQLQDIAASDKGTSADMALISTYMRRREFDKALSAIDVLEKKMTNSPVAGQLRGQALLAKGDRNAARKSFETSLAANQNYFTSIASLAALDVADQKPEAARKRFEDLLSREPKNARAMVALAELRVREPGDHKKQILELLTQAIAADTAETAPRVLLVNYHLNLGDAKQAAAVGQAGMSALPDNPMMLDAAGRAQIAAGDTNQGLTTLGKAAALQPNAVPPLLRLADAQMTAKNNTAAEQSLRKAVELNPDLVETYRQFVSLRLAQERTQDAIALTRTVQKRHPKEVVGYVMEGDARVASKDLDGAVTAYQNGLKVAAGAPELMVRLHAVLRQSGKSAEATRQVDGWLQRQPKDTVVRMYLADVALNDKQLPDAEKYYLSVVRLQPNNAVAYNNLAWVTSELKKDGAIAYAEKANELVPNQPAFMDTMAMLLADKQDFKQAIELQGKVLGLQAQNPLFRLNMARIYAKAGQKADARKLLDELAKEGDKFAGQAEVEKLRATL